MPAAWKTVRVFISSTFRDMHAERDYLVRVVFPALRERLEKYRIHLVDVDLRWGITEEEAQHDRVLDLCLELIDECRPYFVGILGERYGWVPKSFSEEVASKYGWVQYQTGKSVTELESSTACSMTRRCAGMGCSSSAIRHSWATCRTPGGTTCWPRWRGRPETGRTEDRHPHGQPASSAPGKLSLPLRRTAGQAGPVARQLPPADARPSGRSPAMD